MKEQAPPDKKPTTLTLKERIAALQNLPRFFKMIWQTNRSLAAVNVLLRIVKAALPLLILYVGKLIIDQIVAQAGGKSADHSLIWMLVAAEFGLAVLNDGLNRVIALIDTLLSDLFSNHTSVKIMEHAALLDLDQFEDALFYDKLERARQQTAGRTVLLSQVLSQLQDMITVVFLAVGLFAFNPLLILLLFLSIIPAFLAESYFNDQTYARSRRQTPERREQDYLRYLGASDLTAKEVKMFELSAFIIERFRVLSDKFYKENKAISVRRSVWGTLFALLGSAGYYGAYVFIIYRTVTGLVTIGELTFLAGSFRQLRSLLETILSRFTTVAQGAVYLSDFFEFFKMEPKIKNALKPRPFPNPVVEGFEFKDVGFKYANAHKWASRHLSFTLRPGEKLALVGENGAGKTTLVKLLSRLYDPTEGQILLDGHDLKEYDLSELRMNTGVIFQDYLRYQMSLELNIATGNIAQKDNEELIRQSARQSMADKLAKKLEGGYKQMLGKRFADGVDLSGGEWQKIAIARAYMRDAQLLILDEPTSALDARAEFEVFERFTELTKGRMAVLISHRFSTVRMADRILVLENGTLIETGNHEALLAAGGRYAELFNLQALGYR